MQTVSSIEMYPSFTFAPEQLSAIHTTRRQLGKANDVTNSLLVLASRLSKASDVNKCEQIANQFVKYLNNNATWRIVSGDKLYARYGFGDKTSVTHNFENGRITRAQ